jgi:hypothetical protein
VNPMIAAYNSEGFFLKAKALKIPVDKRHGGM